MNGLCESEEGRNAANAFIPSASTPSLAPSESHTHPSFALASAHFLHVACWETTTEGKQEKRWHAPPPVNFLPPPGDSFGARPCCCVPVEVAFTLHAAFTPHLQLVWAMPVRTELANRVKPRVGAIAALVSFELPLAACTGLPYGVAEGALSFDPQRFQGARPVFFLRFLLGKT